VNEVQIFFPGLNRPLGVINTICGALKGYSFGN